MADLGSLPIPGYFDSFEEWGVHAAALTKTEIYVPRAEEDQWERWASAFAFAPPLQLYNIPGPAGFAGWRPWAEAARQVYPGS